MATFCIPRHLVTKLKESALKGEVDIKKLYDMSSSQRREFFAKFTDKELGRLVNTEFEKAMISKQKTALTDWAKSVFSPEAKTKPVFKNVLDKINSLDELGVLNPKTSDAFLEDLVTDKLGISVTPEQVKIITEKAQKINEAQKQSEGKLGNPEFEKENLDFFSSKKEMDDYLLSLNPAHKLKILTGTVGRAAMLAAPKSAILNIGSNTEFGILEAMSRRLSSGQVKGADNSLALNYVKMVNKVYQKTGYDMSRMMSLDDTGVSGQRVLGDTVHSFGKGIIRKAGRVSEDIIFKQLMGAPDVVFSGAHFADSVNLNSIRVAKQMGFKGDALKSKARELMLESMKIIPHGDKAELLRAEGIMDAQYSTYTNKSWASNVSEGIRKVLNETSGDLRLGDYVMPFVKTPANVIAAGIDYAGAGAFKFVGKTIWGLANKKFTEKGFVRSLSRDLIRSGLGFTAATIIANQLDDDDFVGAYDPTRAQVEKLRNSNTNSVRIGNKWISLDWFGPLSVPISAIMYARKYGDSASEKTFQYGKGVFTQITNIPGVEQMKDIFDLANSGSKKQTLSDATGSAGQYAMDNLYSRLVPSVLSDLAKATDSEQRDTGKSSIKTIQSKIPILRNQLPVKKDIFGEDLKDESAWINMVFGSRVKTNTETPLIKEVIDISESVDKPINFTDWDKSVSVKLGQFRYNVGDEKFDKAKVRYGQILKQNLESEMAKNSFSKLSDDDKMKIINNQDSAAQEKVFKEFNFRYIKPKK